MLKAQDFEFYKKISFVKLPATLTQHRLKNTFISFGGEVISRSFRGKIAFLFSDTHKYTQDAFF